jgi:pimeloyl-ACP methyl ester carboxylesterase
VLCWWRCSHHPEGLAALATDRDVHVYDRIDYLPWSAITGYRRTFPQAQLVMIPGAGHVAYVEQAGLYMSLMRAFLSGRDLPLPTLDGTSIPDDYRGTR